MMYGAAVYGRPLTPSEVQANFDAGLDGSSPIAGDTNFSALEGICTPLPSVSSAVSVQRAFIHAYDVGVPAGAFSYSVVGGSATRGGIYSDDKCHVPIVGNGTAISAAYFKAFPFESSASTGAPHTTSTDKHGERRGGGVVSAAVAEEPVNHHTHLHDSYPRPTLPLQAASPTRPFGISRRALARASAAAARGY